MIRINALLCPSRHCIFALAYDAEKDQPAAIKAKLEAVFKAAAEARAINPWCGICGSTRLEFEDQPTVFKTLDEAMPVLKKLEAEQATARDLAASMPKPN